MDGFISYPRTDNTVYPASLNTHELVASLVRIPDFSAAAGLLDGELTPTRGKKETTDHPPIHPDPGRSIRTRSRAPSGASTSWSSAASWRPSRAPMITESTRADIEAGSETYFVRGSVVVDPGYAAIYTYARSADEEIPKLEQGQSLDARRRPVDRRQGDPAAGADQPGQADRDDGGARPGDQGDPRRHHPEALRPRLRVLEPARALGDRDRHVQGVQRVRAADGDPGDDRRARAGHGQIAAGETSKDEVLRISREMLHSTTDDLSGPSARTSPRRSGRGWTRTSSSARARSARRPGASHEDGSPNRLRIIELKGGKRMYGCEGWNRDNPESPDSCQV